jgi:L-glutamine:2-deoxy-scyllo-inosose/3-amino-2,3-dideoxy-scyllo-inosose aminotransferase
VVSVNATPILVDIDLATGCLDAAAVESAVTERTRAIISVHAHCSMADLDSLVALAERHNLELIEDCAQSHGSRWRGRAAGSIGRIGIFSMHQGKPLTCGEGGAAITDDEALFHRMEQLRSNGRRYIAEQPRLGQMDLEQVGETLGTNLAMSEFHAALLLDGLNRLDDQIARKEANARRLDVALRSQRGWLPMERPWQVDRQSYYQYVVRYVPEMFSGRSVSDVCNALEAELGFRPHAIYPPMNRHLLYRPQTKKRHQWSEEYWNSLDPNRFHLPRADRAHSESLAFHHSVLLGSRDDMDAIAKAFEKVLLEAHTIPMQ